MRDSHGNQEGAAVRSARRDGPFAEETVESLAQTLRILADPTRIRLIEALNGRGRASVGVLATGVLAALDTTPREVGG
jgi:hypothetical protein